MKKELNFLFTNQNLLNNLYLINSANLNTNYFYCEVDLNEILKKIKYKFIHSHNVTENFLKMCQLPTIMADPTQMHQLFINLIGNPLKFKSEQPLNIIISLKDQETMWEISIKDNGINIDATHHKNIFNKQYNLNQNFNCKRYEIGLSLCQNILEAHGGTITVQSNLTNGCEFIIWLPKMKCN